MDQAVKTIVPIDDENVLAHIRDRYGLDVAELRPVGKGEVGDNYVAKCTDDERYFVRLLGASRLAQQSSERLAFSLRLSHRLFASGLFSNLPHPIPTRDGALYTRVDARNVVVFDFIEGETLDGRWPYTDETRAAIADTVAAIHATTSQLGLDIPYVEDLDVPFACELERGLDALENVTEADREGKQGLRDLLLPHQSDILAALARLRELGSSARTIPGAMVLCHTDLTGANLLVSPNGELFVLDWESPRLAPPECDLFLFADEQLPSFLDLYERRRGQVNLHAEMFGFYSYRRCLEDITDWVIKILYENTTDAQDQQDLEGVREMMWWPYIEDGIQRIREQLSSRH